MKRFCLFVLVVLLVAVCGCVGGGESTPAPTTTVPPTTTPAPTSPVTTVPPTTTPAPTEPPATPAPGVGELNPFPRGETLITSDGFAITILDVVGGEEAWTIIRDADASTEAPEEGMQYLLVQVRAHNVSSKDNPQTLMAAVSFSYVGDASTIFFLNDKPVTLPSEGAYKGFGTMGTVSLAHGAEETGYLSYYVPSTDTRMILIYGPTWEWGEGDMRFFSLT